MVGHVPGVGCSGGELNPRGNRSPQTRTQIFEAVRESSPTTSIDCSNELTQCDPLATTLRPIRIVADELIGARALCQMAGVCCTGMGIGMCHGWLHGAEGDGGEAAGDERTNTKCHGG